MRTRKAILPDAKHIHELISAYSSDGTLLPRTLAEICENVRDFVVLEHEGRIIGCGALHLYGKKEAFLCLHQLCGTKNGYAYSRRMDGDDAEMLTSEMHDPYTRKTVA